MRPQKIVKTVFLAVFMAMFILGGKAHAAGGVAINSTNFPDATFRNYVKENFDTNKNNSLSQAEIAAVTRIEVRNMAIDSLKGIEYFTSMKTLYCNGNALTELDVSACTALEWLSCYDNALTSLNVAGCSSLRSLDCSSNSFTSLNVSNSDALESLYCGSNQLTSLNCKGCDNLQTLSCGNNKLKSLNVSSCPELGTIYCSNNKIKSINCSGCSKLYTLYCENNQLTSLDLQACPGLQILYCNGNPMTELNIAPCRYLVFVYTNGNYTEHETTKNWMYMSHTQEFFLNCNKSLPISLGDELAIATNPENMERGIGNTAWFYVSATGSGLQFQWQYKYPDGSWKNSINPTAKNPCFEVTVQEKLNGVRYRCVVRDAGGGKVTSTSAKLTVYCGILDYTQSASAYVGGTAKFSVDATGAGLTYRWQVSKDGGSTWKNVTDQNEGYNTDTLKLKVKAAWNSYQYRCVVKDANGKVKRSPGAPLTVKPKITKQPAAASAAVGATAKFSVTATGAGLKYRWQVSKDGGETWKNVTSANEGYNKATLKLVVKAEWNGYRYRCVITDANGKTLKSSGAKLTVK